jgi:hypothetical protein
MRTFVLYGLFWILAIPLFGQMPTNSDYSNWNWEDQSRDNWQKRSGSNTNVWVGIESPFSPTAQRVGELVDVHISQDYTKAKGWELLYAYFEGDYPYFIIYNTQKGVIRVFFRNEDREFSHLLVTLKFHTTSHHYFPGILTYGRPYMLAADQYLNSIMGDKDMISVVIPFQGRYQWGAADFLICFDHNIQHNLYASKLWEIKFFGCDQYDLRLKKDGSVLDASKQHTLTGNSSDLALSLNKFNTSYEKVHKQIESISKYSQQLQSSVSGINTSSPQFMQNYKNTITNMKPLNEVISTASGISAAFGAVLGFAKLIVGAFDESKSTTATATIDTFSLTGSMNIKYGLGGNTLKIPGVQGTYYPFGLLWEPYDCVMGLCNLKTTPTIHKTTPYEKFNLESKNGAVLGWQKDNVVWYYVTENVSNVCFTLAAQGEHPPYNGQYLGKFVQYQFDDTVSLTFNDIPGLDLIDVHLALVFRLTGKNNQNFDITKKTINCRFSNDIGQIIYWPVLNPIYQNIEKGILRIYRYEPATNNVWLGTPLLPMNKLKGIVIETPEYADLTLRVVAKFNSQKYDAPIVFQGTYEMNQVLHAAAIPRLFANMEQTNYPPSNYYIGTILQELNSPTNATYSAGTIECTPNFVGQPGFSATAIDNYPTWGNTQLQTYHFACYDEPINNPNRRGILSEQSDEATGTNLQIFPNPTDGLFTINSNTEEQVTSVTIYDVMGRRVYQNEHIGQISTQVNLAHLKAGVYFIKSVVAYNKCYTNRVIIQ